jgi:Flp pilus assembly protein TadD
MRVAFWHFCRGMALASTGALAKAEEELQTVTTARSALQMPQIIGFTNSGADLLGIARDELGAKIAHAKKDDASARAQLEDAVKIQDTLIYVEPPDWYHPVRESLGGLLVQMREYAQAEAVFRADLAVNPRNPRSLYGLASALEDQGRSDEAQLVREQYQAAWQNADTTLTIESL